MLIFVLNAYAFLIIGLQLPSIVEALEPHVRDYALYGLLLSVTVIVVRIAWIFPASYLPYVLSRKMRESNPAPQWERGYGLIVVRHARHRLARGRAGRFPTR